MPIGVYKHHSQQGFQKEHNRPYKGNLIDMVGKRFGRLIVIKRIYPNTKNREKRWLCKCDCGDEKIVRGWSLRNGDTQSCGCLQKEVMNKRRLSPGLGAMRALILSYKRIAKMRGLEYTLTEEEFKEITQKDCHYCGAKPNNISKHHTRNGNYIYNGIDRVDNNKGYTRDNVAPCCHNCNQAKSALTLQEFLNWLERAYNKNFINKEGVF